MKSLTFFYLLLGLVVLLLYGLLDPEVYPFPRCPFRTLTGMLCPGCGSQRAIHQMIHGNFIRSLELNPLVIPATGYAFIGFCLGYVDRKRWPSLRLKWYGRSAAWVALGVILIFWIGRNII